MTATLVFGTHSQTPEETDRRVASLAGALDAAGVGDGDVVAIMLRNDLPWIDAMLAARRIGAFFAPVNWHYRGEEVGHILADAGARVLIVHSDLYTDRRPRS